MRSPKVDREQLLDMVEKRHPKVLLADLERRRQEVAGELPGLELAAQRAQEDLLWARNAEQELGAWARELRVQLGRHHRPPAAPAGDTFLT